MMRDTSSLRVRCDLCRFGASVRRPATLASNRSAAAVLGLHCDHVGRHRPEVGRSASHRRRAQPITGYPPALRWATARCGADDLLSHAKDRIGDFVVALLPEFTQERYEVALEGFRR